jgi:hypothetical protein
VVEQAFLEKMPALFGLGWFRASREFNPEMPTVLLSSMGVVKPESWYFRGSRWPDLDWYAEVWGFGLTQDKTEPASVQRHDGVFCALYPIL